VSKKQAHKIIAVIPARGGSKGVPRKALQKINDMPLIAYTIRDALEIEGITKVFVNTDDPEIREVSLAFGAEVPFLRPAALAQDDSNYTGAHQYALDWYLDNQGFLGDIEIVMSPTYPFRRKQIVSRAMKKALQDPTIFNVGSIAPVSFNCENIWQKSNESLIRLALPINGNSKPQRFYESAFSFNIVFNFRSHLPDRRVPYELNKIEAIDIDEPMDLELARQVVREGLYPFD